MTRPVVIEVPQIFDIKEVKLKPEIVATQYLTGNTPIIYKDHEVEVRFSKDCRNEVEAG